ncbi:MAG TPA: hypothetical protein VM695_14525, partial [Phycisphaerae bacterium]|nr:hypothetical protein [Phycisphaerae bacterium]
PAMGERFIDSLTGVADALAAGGKYADAISYLRQAVSVAAGIRSARQTELQAEIERLTALDRVYRVAEGFEARLRKDPGDAAARRRLIELYLIELDSPARAEKLLTAESDEILRTYVPLAVKPIAELQNVPCLELGNWYHTLSSSATTPIGKVAMLRRAQGYLEAYVQKADAGDLAAVKVKLTLDKIEKELEALSPEPAAGPWVDVLKLVDPAKHGVSGRWARKGSTLGAKAEGEDRFLVPAAPNGDYELKVQFARTEGDGAISLVLPVGDTSAALLLGYKAGQASGLSYVNGKACDENETRSAGTLSNRTSHTVTVKVTTQGTDARLRGTLDGRKLLDWKGPQSALQCPRSWALPVGTALGLGAEKDSVALFTSAQLRMFSGQVSQVTYAKPPENPWDRIRDAWRDRGQGGPGPGGPGNRPGGPGNRPGPGRR